MEFVHNLVTDVKFIIIYQEIILKAKISSRILSSYPSTTSFNGSMAKSVGVHDEVLWY